MFLSIIFAIQSFNITTSIAGCIDLYENKINKNIKAREYWAIAGAPTTVAGGVLSVVVPPVGIPLLAAGLAMETGVLISTVDRKVVDTYNLLLLANDLKVNLNGACGRNDCDVDYHDFINEISKESNYRHDLNFKVAEDYYQEFLDSNPLLLTDEDYLEGKSLVQFFQLIERADKENKFCEIKKNGSVKLWGHKKVLHWAAKEMKIER